MPEAAPWIREETIRAERSPDVVARREKAECSALAHEMRREAKHRERTHLNFYTTERARSRTALW
jgi:hypothetical protein